MVFLVGLFAIAMIPGYRAVSPAYRRLRSIRPAKGSRDRIKKARIAVAFLFPMIVWITFVTAMPGRAGGWGVALQLAVFVLLLVAAPLLVVRLLPSRSVKGRLSERLRALADRAGVRVADLRVLEVRSSKAANALVIGVISRGRYVLVTDYLLDQFDDDELDAVVAHELGHAKGHHVLLKVGAWLVTVTLLAVAISAIRVMARATDPLWLMLPFLIGLPTALLLVQGALGLVLERRADRFGAKLAGNEAMARALERLADANMAKRRTGFVWNLLTQHPGIEQRVRDLLPAQQPGEGLACR